MPRCHQRKQVIAEALGRISSLLTSPDASHLDRSWVITQLDYLERKIRGLRCAGMLLETIHELRLHVNRL